VTFGSTETGACLASDPTLLDGQWGTEPTEDAIDLSLAMRPIPFFRARFEAQPRDEPDGVSPSDAETLYELVLETTDKVFSWPKPDGAPWRSRDLFKKIVHTDSRGARHTLWLYETRIDDMLMLGNGSCFLFPAPHLCAATDHSLDAGGTIFPAKTEERVYEALEETGIDCAILVVGTSRPFPALIVEGVQDQDAQNKITAALKKREDHINQAFPAYSRLHSDMVYFVKGDEKLARTVKST
jgi:hypothetical protein